MSSHTHPQKVHVALRTISISLPVLGTWFLVRPSSMVRPKSVVSLVRAVNLTRLFVARTGRHEERSSQLPAAVTPSSPSRLESSFLDFGPVTHLLFRQDAVADRLLAIHHRSGSTFHRHSSGAAATTEPEAGASSSSTSTSQPLERGMPVPSVYCPINRHVGGP